jgi:hypothetical protein
MRALVFLAFLALAVIPGCSCDEGPYQPPTSGLSGDEPMGD